MTVTAPALPCAATAPVEQRLRTALRADAVVTGAVGAATLLAAVPLADQVGTPTVLRVVGAVLVVVAVDIALAARLSGRRLALAGTVVGEAALAWVGGTAVVLALGLAEPVGAALMVGVAAVTAGFGLTHLRLARQLRTQR
jgi:hypothetical protein